MGLLHSQTELFEHLEISLLPGVILPQNDLQKQIEVAPSGELHLKSSYYKNFKSHLILGYTPLNHKQKKNSAHFFKTAVGLEYAGASPFTPRVGASLGNYLLTTETANKVFNIESEFGLSPFAFWEAPLTGSLKLRAGAGYDIVLTAPKYSYLLHLNAGVSWSLW